LGKAWENKSSNAVRSLTVPHHQGNTVTLQVDMNLLGNHV